MKIDKNTIEQIENWMKIAGLVRATQARLRASDFAPVRRELEQTLGMQAVQLACQVIADVTGKIPLIECCGVDKHDIEYNLLIPDHAILISVSTARRSRRAEWRGDDAPSENALYVSMHSDVSKLVFDIVKAID